MKTDSKSSLDDDDDDLIRNPMAIVGVLRDLLRNEVRLTATFNGGSDVLLTMLLGVEPDQKAIFLDMSASPESNRRLTATDRIFFSGSDNNATVKWLSHRVTLDKYGRYDAFRVAIPEKLQKIQRRGVYRVPTPIINPILCTIPVGEKDKMRTVQVALVDICVEGIGAVLPETENVELVRGAQFKKCVLHLPEVGDLEVSLNVQACWEVPKANGAVSKRAGFGFIGINPRQQAVLQRFILRLDSQRAATRRNKGQ